MVQPAEIVQNRAFTEENTTSSLKESSSPFFLQEFKSLTLMKATDRFTSLTIMGMTKIMCNRRHHTCGINDVLIAFFHFVKVK
jgi:hypothetical protein